MTFVTLFKFVVWTIPSLSGLPSSLYTFPISQAWLGIPILQGSPNLTDSTNSFQKNDYETIHNHMKTISNPIEDNHASCNICGKLLTGKKRKWCSRTCKNKNTNYKHQNYVSQQSRGLARKIELLKMFDSKCKKCGYCKNYSALSFHHIDPTTKKFGLDIRACSNHTWQSLLEESKKCDLLCLNCHAETHHPKLLV